MYTFVTNALSTPKILMNWRRKIQNWKKCLRMKKNVENRI